MSDSTIQHDYLRKMYSEILMSKMSQHEVLSRLSDEDLHTLHRELTKWFGASPPDTVRVRDDLKLILGKFSLDNIPGVD
jgi:hypothetical protein